MPSLLVQLHKTGAMILVKPWGAVKWCPLFRLQFNACLGLSLSAQHQSNLLHLTDGLSVLSESNRRSEFTTDQWS